MTSFDFDDYETGLDTAEELQGATDANDWGQVDQLEGVQRRQAGMASIQTLMRGGDPRVETAPIGAHISPKIEMERRFLEILKKDNEVDEAIAGPAGIVSDWWDKEIMPAYQAKNAERLIKEPKNEEEWIAQAQQNEPIKIDPQILNQMRATMMEADKAGKAADPTFSVFTNEKTRRWAEWLNREAEVGGIGYVVSGQEQALRGGVLGTMQMAAIGAAESVIDPALAATFGIWNLGNRALRALGGPDLPPPHNFVEGPDGQPIPDASRAPAFMDIMSALWGTGGERAGEAILAGRKAVELEEANRGMLSSIAVGTSRVAGMAFGFGLPAGAAMNAGARSFGALTTAGLQRVAQGLVNAPHLAGAVAAAAKVADPRVAKIAGMISKTFGAAAGQGAFEAAAYGSAEGYGSAFVHGMAMTPVLMGLGWMGKRTEKWLDRKNMPQRMAAALGGAVEGVGFGTLEAAQMGPLWDFLKDPTQSTFEVYAKNILGFMLLKGAAAHVQTPGERAFGAVAPEALALISRRRARAEFAERVARGEDVGAQLGELQASGRVKDVAALKRLGEASLAAKKAATPEEAARLSEERQRLEEQLDVEELGMKEPAKTALKDVEEEQGPLSEVVGPRTAEEMAAAPAEEFRPVTREEVDAIRKMPTGHAKNMALMDAMKRASRTMSDAARKFAEADEAYKMEIEAERYETSDVVRRMFGAPAAPKFERVVAEIVERRDAARKQVESERRAALEGEALMVEPDRRGRELHPHPEKDDDVALPAGAGERGGVGSLQRPPSRQLEETPGTEPVRASDIVAEMQGRPGRAGLRVPFTATRLGATEADPVRVPMRAGRVRGKGVLGVFRYFENLARTAEGRDLVASAHEWSHAMQRHALADRGGMEFRAEAKRWAENLPPDARAEFAEILKHYPGADKMPLATRAMEAWAEWHARNLLGDERLEPSTPNLSREMQAWLVRPENARILGQYERIRGMLQRYNEQGALGRLRMSRVGPTDIPSATERATKPGAVSRFITSGAKLFYDDAVDLRRSQAVWLKTVGRKPEDVSIMDDPVELYDALRMTAGKVVGHWVQRGIKTPAGKITGLKDLMARVKGKQEDFTDYLVAVTNAQMSKRGMATQQPLRDYAYAIKQLQTANPEFRQVARDMKKWSDSIVDYVADSGAISRDSAQRIKDAYVLYIPMMRAIEGPRAQAGGRGVAERGSGIMRRKGSTFEVKDPLGGLVDVATSMVTKAHQHMVMTALYKMAKANEAGGLATVVPRDMVPESHPTLQVIDALQKKMRPPEGMSEEAFTDVFEALRDIDALDPSTITLFSQKSLPTGTRSIIAFTPRLPAEEIKRVAIDKAHERLMQREQDKLLWLEVDTKAYETLMGIDKPPTLGWLDRPVLREILRFPAAMTRFFATGINVGFTLANIPRDVLSYAVFNQKGEFAPFSGMAQWVKGAALYLNKGGDVRELYESTGARTASFYSEGQRRDMLGQHRTIMQKSMHAIATVVDRAKSVLEGPENFLRIAEFRDAYEAAKAAGKGETEARMLGLRAGREITVNFARAGILSRAMNQVIPYFNAALQGQRKVFRQLALGGDAKDDATRARVQRAAFANGIATITIPSMLFWALNHDEEWYQDLPEWRRSLYWNFKLGDSVVSIPKPWELGVLFGSIPEAIADGLTERGKPVRAGILLRDSFMSYLDGPSALLPAVIRPLLEGEANYSFFFQRRLTPEWIEKGRVPEEQATFYTTEIAQILSRAVNGLFTPIEIEHYLGGYTAGATTSAFRAADELLGLKDHPGLAVNPFQRFLKQEPFGQSRTVDELYQLSTKLDQLEGSERLTGGQAALKRSVDDAKRQISSIRRAVERGRASRIEANRRAYEIAKPLVKRGESR